MRFQLKRHPLHPLLYPAPAPRCPCGYLHLLMLHRPPAATSLDQQQDKPGVTGYRGNDNTCVHIAAFSTTFCFREKALLWNSLVTITVFRVIKNDL